MSDQNNTPKKPESLNINRPDDWIKLRQRWMKERAEWVRANADAYFTTDEDLPLSRHIMLISVAVFIALFILWASFARMDEVTRGEGKVVPSTKVQIIQSLEGGIVESFLVREGDMVKVGQPLLRLSNIDAASNLGSNQARYLGLLATVTRLQAEADGKNTVDFPDNVKKGAPQSVVEELNAFTANRTSILSQINVLEQQSEQRRQELTELNTKARDLAGVIAMAVDEKNMVAPLVAKGSAPKMELMQKERDIKERQTELNGVKTAIPRAESAIAEAEGRIEETKKTARAKAQAELASKLGEMNAIKETLGALEDRKDRTEIKSPVNGKVKDLKINTVGGVVKPGDAMMEVVPIDEQLVVEAMIRPKDIAFLHPGQKAVVKITAYDYSIYGGLKGELIDISPDSITNEKGESFYHIKVQTYESQLKRKDEVLPIIPGMVATAEILTGHKTVMEYILKPFIKTVDTAMRER
jgi:membrane fusion protein, adhesin transport system